jgi:flagellin-like protein
MKNFRMNRKGISPIFATLILIAIAVIAGVVVYMFTSGTLATMTGNTSAAQEKITVQGASISKAGAITVYLEQTGGPAATVNSIIIKDTSGTTVGVITALATGAATPAPSPSPLTALTTGTLTTISGSSPSSITVGSSYTLTVTTKAGGSFLSQQITAVA